MTIKIDLDDLTQEHIDRCAPQLGRCRYDAPCIIGTLLKPAAYAGRNSFGIPLNIVAVRAMIDEGRIALPDSQEAEAIALQSAFDSRRVDRLSLMLAKRGLRWPA